MRPARAAMIVAERGPVQPEGEVTAVAFEALKASQAAAYSGAKFELIAATVADIHDDLIGRLGVTPGERWLDLATGTGAVASGPLAGARA